MGSIHKDDVMADIIVPEESAEPTVLGIQVTELGCIAWKEVLGCVCNGQQP